MVPVWYIRHAESAACRRAGEPSHWGVSRLRPGRRLPSPNPSANPAGIGERPGSPPACRTCLSGLPGCASPPVPPGGAALSPRHRQRRRHDDAPTRFPALVAPPDGAAARRTRRPAAGNPHLPRLPRTLRTAPAVLPGLPYGHPGVALRLETPSSLLVCAATPGSTRPAGRPGTGGPSGLHLDRRVTAPRPPATIAG